MAQVVEHLPSKHNALSSNCSSGKEGRRKEEGREKEGRKKGRRKEGRKEGPSCQCLKSSVSFMTVAIRPFSVSFQPQHQGLHTQGPSTTIRCNLGGISTQCSPYRPRL
jgi:hypothetical protein